MFCARDILIIRTRRAARLRTTVREGVRDGTLRPYSVRIAIYSPPEPDPTPNEAAKMGLGFIFGYARLAYGSRL